MDIGNWAQLVILLGSLALLAFVSGATTALTGLRRVQMHRLASADPDEALQFEARLAKYRSSLVVLRLASSVATVSAATLLAADFAGGAWWAIIAAGFASAFLIVLIETPARARAAKAPEAFMESAALPLAVLVTLTRPITKLVPLSAEAAFTHDLDLDPPEAPGPLQGARELKELVTRLEETPEIHEDEREMIEAVLALKETTVKEIMVPQPDIAAISTEDSLEKAVSLFVESGHSRIPLYEGTLDHIVGVLHAKDVLRQMLAPDSSADLSKLAREPYFVPENKTVRALLEEFQEKAVHFALVVDEYGGVEGLVTLDDVLAEIVGRIEGEFGKAEEAIHLLRPGEAIVDGGVSLEEINDELDTELEGDGFDTIGGYVLHHFGRIPKAGDKLDVNGIHIEIVATVGRRIKKLRVKRLTPTPEEVKTAS